MSRLAERYRRLRALADHAETPRHEATVACELADELLRLNPGIEQDAATADEAERDIPYRSQHEKKALIRLAIFCGLSAWTVANARNHQLRFIRVKGTQDGISACTCLWQSIRTRLNEALTAATVGWLSGALPTEESEDTQYIELSKEAEDVAKGAMYAAQPTSRKLLTKGHKP